VTSHHAFIDKVNDKVRDCAPYVPSFDELRKAVDRAQATADNVATGCKSTIDIWFELATVAAVAARLAKDPAACVRFRVRPQGDPVTIGWIVDERDAAGNWKTSKMYPTEAEAFAAIAPFDETEPEGICHTGHSFGENKVCDRCGAPKPLKIVHATLRPVINAHNDRWVIERWRPGEDEWTPVDMPTDRPSEHLERLRTAFRDISFPTERDTVKAIEAFARMTGISLEIQPAPTMFRIRRIDEDYYVFQKWCVIAEHRVTPQWWQTDDIHAGGHNHGVLNRRYASEERAIQAFADWQADEPPHSVILLRKSPRPFRAPRRRARAAIVSGAFRVTSMPRAIDGIDYFVQRWQTIDIDGERVERWLNFNAVSYASRQAAEAAILEYGRRMGTTVTLIRDDGASIVSASPGCRFPEPGLVFVDLPDPSGSNIPEHDGTFRIKPMMDPGTLDIFWTIQTWWSGKSRWTHDIDAPDRTYETRAAAIERIKEWSETTGKTAYVLNATDDQINHWQKLGVSPGTLGQNGLLVRTLEQKNGGFRIVPIREHESNFSTGAYAGVDPRWIIQQWRAESETWMTLTETVAGPPLKFKAYDDGVAHLIKWSKQTSSIFHLIAPAPADEVRWLDAGDLAGPALTVDETAEFVDVGNINGASEAVAAIASETVAALGIKAPAPDLGVRLVVPLIDQLYAIDEWTATGWNRIAEDLTWIEAEPFIRPATTGTNIADAVVIEKGKCEIRPVEGAIGLFDVYIWTGKTWKEIAGNVSRRTADGVVRARALDPEK
jgi:hypothetical protein